MNHKIMDRSEIDHKDLQLMKAMMFGSLTSKYQIRKATSIPYPTLQRKIKRLDRYEMIRLVEEGARKNGELDQRKPERWDLTLKGLVYLILNGGLEDDDLSSVVYRLFELKAFQAFRPFFSFSEFKTGIIIGLREAISDMEYKINFQHFNEEYTASLFLKSAQKGFFNHFRKSKELSRKLVELLRRNRKLQKDVLEVFETELEKANRERMKVDRLISEYNQVIDIIRNIRNHN